MIKALIALLLNLYTGGLAADGIYCSRRHLQTSQGSGPHPAKV